ncbi:MAG: hypothetical protein BMS9Abin12_2202 [Acidimicrobiia bacterium]|nr:MAG: hypothetical protein BMS9Abin12_2202 [Acidimicrobiia bacterium]
MNVFATGITVVAVDGDIIHCWIGPGLDIVVTPAGGNRLWEGLLGNPNADPSDDLITRDGTILDESDNSGYTLSESWQISDEESLFDYADLAHPSKQLLLADVAVNAPTERGQQIDSRQKSIVGIGNNVVLLHEANFAVTVESFGIDRAAIASRWRRAFPDATLADLSVGPDGQAYVLSRSGVKDGTQMILSRLDSDTGAIIAEVTLDGERLVEGSASVVVDDDGRVFVVTTREVDTRAGYLFGVSPQGDTLVID